MLKTWAIAASIGLMAGVVAALAVFNGGFQTTDWVGQRTTGQALVGGPFELVDHTGRTVTDRDFQGRHTLIYFGFARCPDVCPSALQVMSAALDQIGEDAKHISPILITLDPERDTPEVLASYVSAFHPRLVGLTGTPEAVANAARAYRVFHQKVDQPGSAADYTIDHSSIIYLMDAKGQFVTHFTHATPVDVMAKRLREAI